MLAREMEEQGKSGYDRLTEQEKARTAALRAAGKVGNGERARYTKVSVQRTSLPVTDPRSGLVKITANKRIL